MNYALGQLELTGGRRAGQGQGGVVVEAHQYVLCQHHSGPAGAAHGDLVAGAQGLARCGDAPLAFPGSTHFDAALGGGEVSGGWVTGEGAEGRGGQAGKGEAQTEVEGPQRELVRRPGMGLHRRSTDPEDLKWQTAEFVGDINCKRM